MHTQRFAAIDIGTVTCRLLIADADDTGLHELYRACAITNLGEGVDATGVLTDAAMKRVDSQMDVFQHDIERFSAADTPVRVIAMATSASRDARNAADFVAMLARRGITLSVIPGDREAALSFLGASVDFPGKNLVVADIGGGSTELIAERVPRSRFSSIRSTSVAGASPSGFCRGIPYGRPDGPGARMGAWPIRGIFRPGARTWICHRSRRCRRRHGNHGRFNRSADGGI